MTGKIAMTVEEAADFTGIGRKYTETAHKLEDNAYDQGRAQSPHKDAGP